MGWITTKYTMGRKGRIANFFTPLASLAPLCIRWLFTKGAKGAKGAVYFLIPPLGGRYVDKWINGLGFTCKFFNPAHWARALYRGHTLSHRHAISHPRAINPNPACLLRGHTRPNSQPLPGGHTSPRYVKAEVVTQFSTGVIDTRRNIYVLDRARDRLGEESSYYSI